MASQGYAIVDVDDESPNGGAGGGGLEFKTYLDSNPASGRAEPSSTARAPPELPPTLMNLAYYQTFFDVDTKVILKRVGLAMIPRDEFISEICEGQIDLYGPFWTLTTLILTLYTTSTLTSSISQYLASPTSSINSNIPLLSTAASITYFYGLGVPSLLWFITRWLGIGEWGIPELIGIYGYSMTVFIPVSLVCLIPVGILRWVLVGLAAGTSGYFLFRNINPTLVGSDNPMARLLIIGVLVLHAAMAFAMKVLFFSYDVAGYDVGPDPIGTNPIGGGGNPGGGDFGNQ